ncbi:pyridoxamine 5'-phosphate oxidase family protein [Streptomyces sp. TRM68367]|uniref:pyridoxamine 5'-phosphate oxidase family protein n=1 Tax=Streptomyces sp. TRM68367 TaxID=2758415 RepID=UPI0037DDC174
MGGIANRNWSVGSGRGGVGPCIGPPALGSCTGRKLPSVSRNGQGCFVKMRRTGVPDSLKALDLRRDPRFALQANPGEGTGMVGGDVRISGRAIEVGDPGTKARYTQEVEPPEPFHLFRTELTEIVRTYVEDEKYLVVEVWKPGEPLRTIKRT